MLRKYPISFILPVILIVWQLWRIWEEDCNKVVCNKFIHWSGKEGFVKMWHYWISFEKLALIMLIACFFVYDRRNKIETYNLLSFMVWACVDLLLYIWHGWPLFTLKILNSDISPTLFGCMLTSFCITLLTKPYDTN